MKREYTVIIERSESGGYVGIVPGITGCHSQGESIDELMEHMEEVLELCLECNPEGCLDNFVDVKKISLPA